MAKARRPCGRPDVSETTSSLCQRTSIRRHAERGAWFGCMVDGPPAKFIGIRMNDAPKPLSAATIHSVYSGKTISAVVDETKDFQSTKRFARDPAHSGQSPQQPKNEKGPFRRG